MALAWVIGGTIAQLLLAMFLFMFVAFSASGIGNVRTLTPLQDVLLTLSLFALPGSCLISATAVIYSYRTGAGPMSYWWHALPAVLAAIYLTYALLLNTARTSG